VQRAAVASATPTAITRAFSGRLARGIRNAFMAEHDPDAPVAYPEVHHLTSPLRAAGRAAANPDLVNLWAGQAHELTRDLPAGELVAVLADEARAALAVATSRLAAG
jgi:nitronate monooxygenase